MKMDPRIAWLGGRILDVLAPCACLACGAIEPGSMFLGLCSRCGLRLEPVESPRRQACDLCGTTLQTPARNESHRCIPCLQKRASLDRLYCAWSYQEPLEAVIHGLKFRDLTYLGAHIADALDRMLPPALAVDAVVPVPLHWRRSWTRGYNQAEEIARPLAGRRGWKLERPLLRRRSTPAQSGLGRAARLVNLRQAFAMRGLAGRGRLFGRIGHRFRAPISRKRLLLIDDVYTTGATLEAAAAALRTAGAAWVGAAVAGRTPGPNITRSFCCIL